MNKHEIQDRRDKMRQALPALAIRIFALRGKQYNGFGFHWGKEKSVGGLLYRVNNFDARYSEEDLLNDEVIFEGLVEDVTEIEKSVLRVAS